MGFEVPDFKIRENSCRSVVLAPLLLALRLRAYFLGLGKARVSVNTSFIGIS